MPIDPGRHPRIGGSRHRSPSDDQLSPSSKTTLRTTAAASVTLGFRGTLSLRVSPGGRGRAAGKVTEFVRPSPDPDAPASPRGWRAKVTEATARSERFSISIPKAGYGVRSVFTTSTPNGRIHAPGRDQPLPRMPGGARTALRRRSSTVFFESWCIELRPGLSLVGRPPYRELLPRPTPVGSPRNIPPARETPSTVAGVRRDRESKSESDGFTGNPARINGAS